MTSWALYVLISVSAGAEADDRNILAVDICQEEPAAGARVQNYFTHWTGRRGTVVEVKLEQIVCGILAFRTPDAASSPWLIPAADQHRAKQMPNTRQQQSKKRKRSVSS